MNKKVLIIVALTWVVGVFLGAYYTYFSGSTSKKSDNSVLQTISSTIKESVTEKQFKDILKSYDERDWNTFNKKVDIALIVHNGVEEAFGDVKKKKTITQDEKTAINLMEGLTPLAIEHTKSEFHNYFMRGTDSSNYIVKIFSIKPEKILAEKDENNFKILPVAYLANKKEILVKYKFMLENDAWKLVGISGHEDVGRAMGWSEDKEYTNSYAAKNEKIHNSSHYENSYNNDAVIKYQANETNNAYKTAESYAYNGSGMSKRAVYEQLLFEGFSERDSQNAIEKLTNVDWKKNAFESALSYQTNQHMSKKAIKEQLLFEGFTGEEADYAVNKLH